MTDDPTDPRGPRGALIDRLVRRAKLAVVWEGLWPAVAAALVVGLAFLTVSWFGLWDALPPYGRMAGVAVFAVALVAALFPLSRIRGADRRALLARVDRASGLAHRPATGLDDRLAPLSDDPLTRALWQAHRDRVEGEARRLRAGSPAPRLAARDPYAVRFLAGLIAVVAFAEAGGDRGARVASAFDWATPAPEVAPVRIDAWIAPPAYTGRPPLFLTGGRAVGAASPADPRAAASPVGEQAAAQPEALRVPTGSILVVRAAGGTIDVTAEGAAEPQQSGGRPPDGVSERRFRLTGDAALAIRAAGETAHSWRFAVVPDQAPEIALKGQPQRNARGSTTVAYTVKDDYGVAGAEARFALKPEPETARSKMRTGAGAEAPKAPRPLYEPPKLNLGLPRPRARDGEAQTSLDLQEHPWAGADVTMTLNARDEAGQEGVSAAIDMRLPARTFTNPLARALVEQRRTLALDAEAKPEVAKALQALMLFPDEFTPRASTYLGLRSAYRRLDIASTDDQLREVADYLWQIALRLEDGDLPQAEKELRAAEEALRKALEEGASEQEIARLTQDLRQALEKFMQELAQRAQQQPNSQAQRTPNGAQAVRPDDLRKMIDRMEQMAKSGSREAAQQALNDLRNMLDNLQTAQRQQQQADPNAQAQQQQMDKLQDVIREQNKLRDRTYQQYRQQERAQQNQRGQQGRRQQGQRGQQEEMQALADEQKQLRDKLDQLMKEMQQGQQGQQQQGQRRQGQRQPGQQGQGQQGEQGEQAQQGQGQKGQGEQPGENALDQAGESMGDARGALGEGQTGQALDDQGKALENLRKGAQALSEQMQNGEQAGQPGQQGQPGRQGMRDGEEGRDDDPLGRPVRRRESDGTTTKVPGEIEAQRARRVLEELRRRLGDGDRPREELDYLERLLTP